MCIDLDQRIRQDLLYRLRWNLLDAVEDIEIATGPHDQTINVPFLSHPLAGEPLFSPPLDCIDQIIVRDFADKQGRDIYYPKEERYKPPAPLQIANQGGSPITLGQFVTEVHTYVRHNIDEIKRVKNETYGELVTHADGSQRRVITFGRPVRIPDNVAIFFGDAMPFERDGDARIQLTFYAEGEVAWPNGFWAARLLQVRTHEARR